MPEHLTLEFVTRDKDGKVLERMEHECHSFLTQYYQVLYSTEAAKSNTAGSTINVTDTSNTSQALVNTSYAGNRVLACLAAAADNTYGIQVGTGSSANTGATYKLDTLIAHGVGAGQLSYGSTAITVPTGTTPFSYTFTRTLTNNSGGTVNITEAGLVFNTSANSWLFLVIRDTGFGTVAVLTGTNTTATYTLSYTIA